LAETVAARLVHPRDRTTVTATARIPEAAQVPTGEFKETAQSHRPTNIGATKCCGAVICGCQPGVIADQQFRERLKQDMLPFDAPLQAMMPWDGGGPGWIDGLLPVIEDRLAKMEKRDPYHLVAKTKRQPRLQITSRSQLDKRRRLTNTSSASRVPGRLC